MFLIRNYNRYVVDKSKNRWNRDDWQPDFYWEDFYVHRFEHDFSRLAQFETREAALKFLKQHPELEERYDAWIVEEEPSSWNHSQFARKRRENDRQIRNFQQEARAGDAQRAVFSDGTSSVPGTRRSGDDRDHGAFRRSRR